MTDTSDGLGIMKSLGSMKKALKKHTKKSLKKMQKSEKNTLHAWSFVI